MIQSSAPYWQGNFWKKALSESVRSAEELFEILGLPEEYLEAAKQVATLFPLKVTRSYLSRIKYGDIHDPLLLQILPLHLENQLVDGFSNDPLGESLASPLSGVIHKYSGRVLLITTGACAVHCRYCFRRHYPYAQSNASHENWQAALNYIAADDTIYEVILSGGDPLSLSNQKVTDLIRSIAEIPQVTTLRIHTRLPIALPQRISDSFVTEMTATRLQIVMVIHTNHANEINHDVSMALGVLRQKGVLLLNQSVLLHKINDNATTLIALSKKLVAEGVMPYYLHVLDQVKGAAHFSVDTKHIQTIYTELKKQLPGYMVPKLVKELAGAQYKLPMGSQDFYG